MQIALAPDFTLWENKMANWYYQHDGAEHGPVDSRTLKQLAVTGQIQASTLLRREDQKNWMYAASVKGLLPEGASRKPSTDSRPEVTAKPVPPEIPPTTGGFDWFSWPVVGISLLVCFPVGLYLVWKHPTWQTRTRWAWTGVSLVLALVGIVANEPDRPSEQTAEQGEKEQADPQESGPAKIVHDTCTRIEMPPIPEARQVTMTWQEFSETYNGQPSLPVRVKQIENIDFTSGPNGEPIWRCFYGTEEDGKKGRWGDAYFYIEKDSGRRIFHGTITYYHDNRFPSYEVLVVHGTDKAANEWTKEGKAEQRDVYRGDDDHKRYTYAFYRGGQVSQMSTHRVDHSTNAMGLEEMKASKHGIQAILKPDGSYLNHRMFKDGREVGLLAWENGQIVGQQGDIIVQPNDETQLALHRHPNWKRADSPPTPKENNGPNGNLTASFLPCKKGSTLKYVQEVIDFQGGGRKNFRMEYVHRFHHDGKATVELTTIFTGSPSQTMTHEWELKRTNRGGEQFIGYDGVLLKVDAQPGDTWTSEDGQNRFRLVRIENQNGTARAILEMTTKGQLENALEVPVVTEIVLLDGVGVESKTENWLVNGKKNLGGRTSLVTKP